MQARMISLAILGPTASGKTGFAVSLAKTLGGEIICLDSTTVYRGFDIGSAKPTREQRQAVPHHLLDFLEPDAPFSAFDFVAASQKVMEAIASRGKIPILVGGSYFYFRALQNGMFSTGGYSEEALEAIAEEFSTEDGLDGAKLHAALRSADSRAAETIHPNDLYRLLRSLALVRSGVTPSQLKPSPTPGDWLWVKYAMAISRKGLFENIAHRTRSLLKRGLVEETKHLQERFPKARALGSIGYAETGRYLRKEINEEHLMNQINENTRKLVKRQMTWLRSDPEIRFIDSRDLGRVELEIGNLQYALRGSSCNP